MTTSKIIKVCDGLNAIVVIDCDTQKTSITFEGSIILDNDNNIHDMESYENAIAHLLPNLVNIPM